MKLVLVENISNGIFQRYHIHHLECLDIYDIRYKKGCEITFHDVDCVSDVIKTIENKIGRLLIDTSEFVIFDCFQKYEEARAQAKPKNETSSIAIGDYNLTKGKNNKLYVENEDGFGFSLQLLPSGEIRFESSTTTRVAIALEASNSFRVQL